METTTQEAEPKRPFIFEEAAAAFGMRERERVRRLLRRRKIEAWIGTLVVMILVACAVAALVNTKISLSDNPSIQGFRKK